ncbi:MAG: hypothetical protein AUI92_05565 [Thaumarchaeota archaeon 13_1_40CM_3_38_6]|nr:MAG: hypothetical protein AUI92_05565 [Thaumarchaeota archaeon 13_1_40CM_3_38_6]
MTGNLIYKKFLLTPIANTLNPLSPTKQLDLIFILSLGYIVFLTRSLFLQNYGETMINYDSYTYFYTAVSSVQNHNFSLSPFILFLAGLYNLAGSYSSSDLTDVIQFVRYASIISSIHLIVFFYLIARKMFKHVISFMGTLLASFTTLFVIYSVNLHNDVFALSFGFTALYFSIMPRRILRVVLSGICIVIAGLTRPDTYVIFIVPFVIGLSYYIKQKINKNFYLLAGILLIVLIIIPFIALQSYYLTVTRFNPIEKITLFLTYDNIKLVWEKSVQVTQDDTVDKLFLSGIVIGMSFLVYNIMRRRQLLRQLNYKFSQPYIVAIYLILVFFLNILNLTTYHIPYSIVNDTILMSNKITLRYLIGSQILLVYGFTYALSLLTKPSYYYLRDKPMETKEK